MFTSPKRNLTAHPLSVIPHSPFLGNGHVENFTDIGQKGGIGIYFGVELKFGPILKEVKL